ncbi:LCP family protein [Sediminihabitans luteus]|uniref:LCP family protein n=1 Tax=Sediminihabitans luteus TaxID=1138585 RepID=UPI001EF2F3DE|nr:LCP family protein [Sediminihabitans luteus]
MPRPPRPADDARSGARITRQSTRNTGEQPVSRPSSAPRRTSAAPERTSRPPSVPPRDDRRTAVSTTARPSSRPAAGQAPRPAQRPSEPPRGGSDGIRIRKGRVVALLLVLVLVLLIAWPVGLIIWANGKVQHVDALSGAAGTDGETYLLAGSDAREEGVWEDGTTGARTDSIMLLQKPDSGPASLISLPRDTYVEDIPGHGPGKLNAAYSYGGPALLVQTVEGLTGITVDHYVEIGFGGIEDIVDAVGGVELCLDYDVDDEKSGLVWEAGCHVADGETALAFSRMRYSDPKGDIGRAERQRQVIGAVADAVVEPSLLWHPGRQVDLIDAGTAALTVDESSGMVDLAKLGLAFRAATGPDGVTGTPPISNPDYRPGGVGSTVLLDPETVPQFWTDVLEGNFEPGETVGGLPGA